MTDSRRKMPILTLETYLGAERAENYAGSGAYRSGTATVDYPAAAGEDSFVPYRASGQHCQRCWRGTGVSTTTDTLPLVVSGTGP